MKNLIRRKFLAAVVALFALALASAACAVPVPTTQAAGKAVFTISDAAANMGAITSVTVTIDSVEVHEQGGAWATVSSSARTFDLMKLRASGTAQLLAETDLKAGSYDQLRLNVSRVVVSDASGEHEAKLPSNKLQMKGDLQVKADATATADFDFIADRSLHLTGEGRYIMAPVVQLETRAEATAEVQADSSVRVSAGRTTTDVEVGMDVDGNMDAGLGIALDAVLSVNGSGKVVQSKGQRVVTGTIKSVDAASGLVTITTNAGADVALHLAGDIPVKVNGTVKSASELAASQGSVVMAQFNAETGALTKIAVGSDAAARTESGAQVKIDSAITVAPAPRTPAPPATATPTSTPPATPAQARTATTATVQGTLKAVNLLAGTVTIAVQGGADVVLNLGQQTAIQANGSSSAPATLPAFLGSQASAEYDIQARTASRLQLTSQRTLLR